MCELLEVSRSLVYYHLNRETSVSSKEEEIIEEHIKEIFSLVEIIMEQGKSK